jgi:hypothetical protein
MIFNNNTLNKQVPLKIGDKIQCPLCGGEHVVEGGKDSETGKVTDLLLFYKCGHNAYLAGVDGRSIMDVPDPETAEEPQEQEEAKEESCDTCGHPPQKGNVLRLDNNSCQQPFTPVEVQNLLRMCLQGAGISATVLYRVLATLAAWLPLHQSCTCDDFCDDPCPVHARENELQDQLTQAREDVKFWQSKVKTDGEVEYWKEAYGRLAGGECLNCGNKDPHRLRSRG